MAATTHWWSTGIVNTLYKIIRINTIIQPTGRLGAFECVESGTAHALMPDWEAGGIDIR